MRHAAWRIDEYAPCAALGRVTAAWAPAERCALVREARIDAERVLDLRLDKLAAPIERAEFLPESINRFAGSEREAANPLLAVARASDHRQAWEPAEVLVADRP